MMATGIGHGATFQPENKNKSKNRYELLVFGFIREFQEQHKLSSIIPTEVSHVVLQFYPQKIIAYGIGRNRDNKLAAETQHNSNELTRYTELDNLNKICNDPDLIYVNQNSITVQDANTKEVYIAGNKNMFNENFTENSSDKNFSRLSDVIAGNNDKLKLSLFHNIYILLFQVLCYF